MARIRTIKPEFPQSESMGRVSRDARLLFIMLWTICDDAGKARGNSRMLASILFPYDEDAQELAEKWLSELEEQKCISRYEIGGDHYIAVNNWIGHQKIDKPSKSRFPDPPTLARKTRKVAKAREDSPLDQGSKDRTKDQGSLAAPFEEFWKAYPRKEAKADALKAYTAAVAGCPPEVILAGARRYASEKRDDEMKYIKLAGGWLRTERWKDAEDGKVIRPYAFANQEEMEAQKKMKERMSGQTTQ